MLVDIEVNMKEINETVKRIEELRKELEMEADKLSRQAFDLKITVKE